jgi:hypothetical protein
VPDQLFLEPSLVLSPLAAGLALLTLHGVHHLFAKRTPPSGSTLGLRCLPSAVDQARMVVVGLLRADCDAHEHAAARCKVDTSVSIGEWRRWIATGCGRGALTPGDPLEAGVLPVFFAPQSAGALAALGAPGC